MQILKQIIISDLQEKTKRTNICNVNNNVQPLLMYAKQRKEKFG